MAFLLLITSAVAVSISGWVIDNECWAQPNHVGFDGAKLDTAPQDHTVHCLLLKVCKESGFFLRDNVTGTLSNVGAFDAAGNAKVITFLEALKDSQANVYVSVEADIAGTGESAKISNVASIAAKSSPAPTNGAAAVFLSPLAALAFWTMN
jgi:hypothetical protein